MNFNLMQTHNVTTEIGPFKQLSSVELNVLVDTDIDGLSFDVSLETCSLLINLNARYQLDKLVYYRDEAVTENVAVYGKQGTEGHVWQELTVTTTPTSVEVTFTGNTDKFQELKVIHTVIVGTSLVYEIELWSSSESLGFGNLSNSVVYSLDSGTNSLEAEEIQLFNNSLSDATIYCTVDTDTNNYLGLSLATQISGTYYGAYENSLAVPNTFMWSTGSFNNVVETNQNITLVTGTYGFYITPVMDVDSVEGRRVFWEATLSGANRIGVLPEANTLPTVGVRFSDVSPTDLLWVTGEMSLDSLWSVTSGTLPFISHTSNTIISSDYKKFFQVKVELSSPEDGQTPILHSIGLEKNISVSVSPGMHGSVFAKSRFNTHSLGRTSGLIIWSADKVNSD